MKLYKLVGNKSWVGILNILLIQWFFIRLEVCLDDGWNRNIIGFNILGFVVPVSGWRTTGDYIFLGRERRFKIWSK